jgi:hypothetical protein
MSGVLYRLAYFSHNRLDDSINGMVDTLGGILWTSRRNNRLHGVTGALMYNFGCFAQILEGSSESLELLFERIQQDPRHTAVTLLTHGPAHERRFERWSMGYIGTLSDQAEMLCKVSTDKLPDPTRITGDDLFDTLRRIVQENEEN